MSVPLCFPNALGEKKIKDLEGGGAFSAQDYCEDNKPNSGTLLGGRDDSPVCI